MFKKRFQKFATGMMTGLLVLAACSEVPTEQNTPIPNQINVDQLQLKDKSNATTPTTSTKTELTNQLVWEVRPQGKTEPISYLIGTVHAPYAESYSVPTAFIESTAQSKVFFMEADASQAASAMEAELVNTINPDQRLQDDLGAEDFSTLQKRLISEGVPENVIDILPIIKPWYLSIILSSPPQAESIDPNQIMDMVLKAQAEKAGQTIRYFETPRQQLQQYQSIARAELIRLIKAELHKSEANLLNEYQEIFTVYNAGDLTALETQSEKARSDSEAFYQALIVQRNQNWLKTLSVELANQPCTVAVGALHMLGEEGLVAQLQAVGFEVKAVQYNS